MRGQERARGICEIAIMLPGLDAASHLFIQGRTWKNERRCWEDRAADAAKIIREMIQKRQIVRRGKLVSVSKQVAACITIQYGKTVPHDNAFRHGGA